MNTEQIIKLWAKSIDTNIRLEKEVELHKHKSNQLLDMLAEKSIDYNNLKRDYDMLKKIHISSTEETESLKEELKEAYEDIEYLEMGVEYYQSRYEEECCKKYKEYI
jgi:uncharacterized protein YdiU (UPF0061 family)